MKQLIISVLIVLVMGCVSCSSSPVPELSDEYLIGIDYGGSSWGTTYDCIDARVIVCTNRDVLVLMPTTSRERAETKPMEQIAALKLTEEQYAAINEGLDREKLYNMRVGSDTDVCDGSTYYLILYDKEENVLKECGGYMPTSKSFNAMYKAVVDNIPGDEIMALREEYLKNLEKREEKEKDIALEQEWLEIDESERISTTDSYLEGFMKGTLRAKYMGEADKTSYIDTKVVLEEGTLFNWDDIVYKLGRLQYGPGAADSYMQTGDVSYRLIDCGNDGLKELCVEGEFNNEYGLHMIVCCRNYGLRTAFIQDSWSRSDVSIDDNGVITTSGSAGATVHASDYAYVDADGKYNFCYGVTQTLPVFENMYVQKDDGEPVSLSGEGLDTEHLGLNEYRFEDENGKSTYYYEYFVVDDDHNDITTEADYSDSFEFRKRFADLGIKTHTPGEIKEIIEARKEEIHFPG